jgi:hypothetical protein
MLMLCVFGSPAAQADMVTWTAGGPVTALADPTDMTDGATQWSLEVTFDTLSVDMSPGDPSLGTYPALSVLTMNTFSVSFASQLLIYNDAGGGAMDAIAIESSGVPAGWNSFSAAVTLQDWTATALVNDAIPGLPPGVNAFGQRSFGIIGQTTGVPAIQAAGEVETLVPEPASAVLLALGGLAMWHRRRR